MKYSKLNMLNFMALCCVLGMFTKKMINPFANIFTEILRIPGGISTGFSVMFLVIATEIVRSRNCGTLMATVQGFLALALGRVGSMGILMPLGYISTGIAIDCVYFLQKYIKCSRIERMVFANSLSALMASVTANAIVFHLSGPVMWLYFGVSATSGMCYGFLGSAIVTKLYPIFYSEQFSGGIRYENT